MSIIAYEGNIAIINEKDESSGIANSNLGLHIKFSTQDEIDVKTDLNGNFKVNESDIFCWNNCNLVPPIKGEYLTLNPNSEVGVEYTTSNYINQFPEYYENIIIDLSSQKYNFKEESKETNNIPQLGNAAYYIEYNGTVYKQESENLILSLNAFWAEIQIGNETLYFQANNETNEEFTFNYSREMMNQSFYLKYIIINNGEKPNLKFYDENINNFTILPKDNLIYYSGFVKKIKGFSSERTLMAKSFSAIPEPALPPFSLSMKCSRLENPSSSYYPILLIHGLHGDKDDYWAYIPDKFSKEGFKVYQVQYIPANGDNRYNAFLLKKCIDLTKKNASSSKVNLVAHSMGGLVAQTYLAGLGRDNQTNIVSYSGDVNSLVTIGSPLYGSQASNRLVEGDTGLRILYKATALFSPYFWENFSEPAYRDLSIGSSLTWNLNEKGLTPSVKYLAITGIANDIIIPSWIFYEADDSDFLVSASSASMRNLGVPLVLLQLNHANEHGQSAVPFNWCNGLLNLCDVEPMVKGISSFLKGNNEQDVKDSFNLKKNEYYISSNSQVSDNSPFNEGAVIVKLNTKRTIFDVELKSNFDIEGSHKFFNLRTNNQTGLFYHYNYGEVNLIDCLKDRVIGLNLSFWDVAKCGGSIGIAFFTGEPSTALVNCINSVDKIKDEGINVYEHDLDLCFSRRPIDWGVTLPSGNYSIFIDGVNSGRIIMIKPLQTNVYEFNICLPHFINTSWTPWNNLSCLKNDKMNQSRFLIQYDSNYCEQNKTLWEYRSSENCSFCNPDIKAFYTSWSSCNENKQKERIKYYTDNNYQQCCLNTGLDSDCLINNPIYQNVTEQTDDGCNYYLNLVEPNKNIYNNPRINFNLNSNIQLIKLEYLDNSDSRPKWTALCTNCILYNKPRNLKEGNHTITFRGIKADSQELVKTFSFFIDSRDPKISTVKPQSRKYTNGNDFYIKYSEDNCQSLKLLVNSKEILSSPCDSGKNIEKTISLNINSYNGQEVEYQFLITDIVNNTDESRPIKVKVDTTAPEIKDLKYPVISRYAYFNMTILNEDKNSFNKVEYIDNSDSRPKWTSLCTSLKNNICYKKVNFRPGNHNIIIKVSDDAGNTNTESLNLTI